MLLIQSDYDDITLFIVDECKKINLDLNEGARKLLISKAIGIFCNQGLRMMREQIAWEIKLLAPTMIERGTDRTLELCKVKREWTHKAKVSAYLAGIGCGLYRTSKVFYTVIPKTYDMSRVRARIALIQKGK